MANSKEVGARGRYSLVLALFFVISLIVSDQAQQMVKSWVDTVFVALSPFPRTVAPMPTTVPSKPIDAGGHKEIEVDLCPSSATVSQWTPADTTSLISSILQFIATIAATTVSYLALRPRPVKESASDEVS